MTTPFIQVVVVLYNRSFEESESLSSLITILDQRPDWAHQFSLLVYDNSPNAQSYSAHSAAAIAYVHDPANGGLAAAYNTALAAAEKERCGWLLLLDQDTTLTSAFVGELLEITAEAPDQPMMGAIVPKLMVDGKIHSPAPGFISQLRSFRRPGRSVYLEAKGMQAQELVAYNSGSTLRVSALRAMGGFPADYWLDFLDHAVFHRLSALGYRVYVMNARLTHDFSTSDVGSVPAWRQLGVLRARSRFVNQSGNWLDRLFYRAWLLRHARRLRASGAAQEVWRSTARAAFRLPQEHEH